MTFRIVLISLLFSLSLNSQAKECFDKINALLFPLKYAQEKISEIPQYTRGQLLTVYNGAYVMRQVLSSRTEYIPLDQIKRYHNMTTTKAKAKLANRIETAKEYLSGVSMVDQVSLNTMMPSVTPIKLIRDIDGKFIPFDGGGRVLAMQMALGEEAKDLKVQVEILHVKNRKKVLKKLHQVIRVEERIRETRDVI